MPAGLLALSAGRRWPTYCRQRSSTVRKANASQTRYKSVSGVDDKMPLHTVNRALLHSTGLPGDILYCTDDESFWLVLGAPTMRRVPVTSLFSGVHQCGHDGGRGEQG